MGAARAKANIEKAFPDNRPIPVRFEAMCAKVGYLLMKQNLHDRQTLLDLNMNGIRMARLAWLMLEEERAAKTS